MCYVQTNLSYGSHRRTFVRHKDAGRCLMRSVKHGGGHVMVWGCFGAGKVGEFNTTKLCMNYLGKKQQLVSICNGVVRSPDLNPIELLLDQHDRMVCKKCPSSRSNLWEELLKAWAKISPDCHSKLTARGQKGRFFIESKNL
ncbi:hypothetical protein GDO81_021184 [Engystomops pustulosus]|uniref:Uncharacterized protein n=1 Tax=Engystomops pustulosus TaxID=76066 RepID=A0AAV6YZQ0_ENGPU|nr:hypothetical protein GDO81_021184 [Engystomops pustulosus]